MKNENWKLNEDVSIERDEGSTSSWTCAAHGTYVPLQLRGPFEPPHPPYPVISLHFKGRYGVLNVMSKIVFERDFKLRRLLSVSAATCLCLCMCVCVSV